MSKLSLANVVGGLKQSISRHSPEILTGIGIAGMITTTVLAVKATPKAVRLCEDLRDQREHDGEEEPTKLEYAKEAWKCYIPAAVTCACSVGCLIGASSVNVRRNAALAAAYTLSDTALREYKEKVIEEIGEKKERAIRDKIAEDHVKQQPVSKNEVLITEKGNTLCYDAHSGRYFRSDIDKIKKAENALNKQMLNEMYVSLNDFYDELGLAHTQMGDDVGWNIDNGLVDIDFSSQIADDGTPCLVIEYSLAPKYNYYKLV